MFDRLFLHHPRSIGESYGEHGRVALGFGFAMIGAGFACIAHALVPALWPRTASDTVKRLFAFMQARQPAPAARRQPWSEPEWQIEYEI